MHPSDMPGQAKAMLGSPAIDPAVGNTSISGVVEPAVGLMPLTNYRRKNCRSPENIVHGGVVSMAEHTGINACWVLSRSDMLRRIW